MTSLDFLAQIHASLIAKKPAMAEYLLQMAIKDALYQRYRDNELAAAAQNVEARERLMAEGELSEVPNWHFEQVVGHMADAELAPIADSGPVPARPPATWADWESDLDAASSDAEEAPPQKPPAVSNTATQATECEVTPIEVGELVRRVEEVGPPKKGVKMLIDRPALHRRIALIGSKNRAAIMLGFKGIQYLQSLLSEETGAQPSAYAEYLVRVLGPEILAKE